MWIAVLIIHSALLATLFPLILVLGHLLFLYLRGYGPWLKRFRSENSAASAAELSKAGELPFVTVQLPVYNEAQVVARLIDAVAALDYPVDRFEIQVLDDSTDETVGLIQRQIPVARERRPGLRIAHLRRSDRTGYKAGSLNFGLETAQGELIAIFDADFVPQPDFLTRTLPAFQKPEVGIVQTRWGHLNETESTLTRSLAIMMDTHFSVEQGGRWAGKLLSNFSGTAGIWRRRAIEEAGGWEWDTLTEDIDLSVRAQLKGWRVLFFEDVAPPAELPASITVFQVQHFRWIKGSAAVARKLLPRILFGSGFSWTKKVHAAALLLGHLAFPIGLLAGVLSVPLLCAKSAEPRAAALIQCWMGLLALIVPFQLVLLWATRRGKTPMKPWRLVAQFLHLSAVFSGLSASNSVAAFEGWTGRRSPFVRTPKRGDAAPGTAIDPPRKKIGFLPFLEALLALYYVAGIVAGVSMGDYTLLPFQLLSAVGMGMVSCGAFREAFAGGSGRSPVHDLAPVHDRIAVSEQTVAADA